jgi:hypothetical protein
LAGRPSQIALTCWRFSRPACVFQEISPCLLTANPRCCPSSITTNNGGHVERLGCARLSFRAAFNAYTAFAIRVIDRAKRKTYKRCACVPSSAGQRGAESTTSPNDNAWNLSRTPKNGRSLETGEPPAGQAVLASITPVGWHRYRRVHKSRLSASLVPALRSLVTAWRARNPFNPADFFARPVRDGDRAVL